MENKENNITVVDTNFESVSSKTNSEPVGFNKKTKKISPMLKKVSPFLAVGVLCFIVGIGTGRAIDKQNNKISNSTIMQQNFPGGNVNNGQPNAGQSNRQGRQNSGQNGNGTNTQRGGRMNGDNSQQNGTQSPSSNTPTQKGSSESTN
jgi:hypothetical protein